MSDTPDAVTDNTPRPPGARRRPSGETPAVTPAKTSAPPPTLIGPTLPRPLRFKVSAVDRGALILEATEALRSYRTDVAAWWVILDVEGTDSGADYGTRRPAQWVAEIEATPIHDYDPARYADRRHPFGDADAFVLEVACPHDDDHRDPTSTAWAVSLDLSMTNRDGAPGALSVTVAGDRGDDHVHEEDARWLEAVITRELTGTTPISRETALVNTVLAGIDALRVTREYIDPSGQALPALSTWAWFDWLNAAQDTVAALGYGFEEWRPVQVLPQQVAVPAPPSPPGGTPPVGPQTGETAAVAPPAARPVTDGSELWDRRDGGTGGLGGDVTQVDRVEPTEVTLRPSTPDKPRGRLARLGDKVFGPVNPGTPTAPGSPAVGLSDLRD